MYSVARIATPWYNSCSDPAMQLQDREEALWRRARLRYAVAARVRSDRAEPALVATQFGITEQEVDMLVREQEAHDRAGATVSTVTRVAKTKTKIAAEAVQADMDRWLAIQRMFESAGRTVPSAVREAYCPVK